MLAGWSTKHILITVRTYPVPSRQSIEVSCTAGITDDGQWIRLFPVPYRFLSPDKRFSKYQWVDVTVTKPSTDQRPESYRLRADLIQVGQSIGTTDGWRARKDIVLPLRKDSLCQIVRERRAGGPTLGLFKPASVSRLTIRAATPPDWTPKQRADLGRQLLGFERTPTAALEKIPFDFLYNFRCSDLACRGHQISCIDWEMAEAFRGWRVQYGGSWETKFRQTFEKDMISKYDTYFFVGNMHQHQDSWLIVGLFYPPKAAILDLFDR